MWIVIQGTSSAVVDEVSYECQAGEAFFTTDKLPSSYTSRVAGETMPFLGLVIELSNDFTWELAAMPDLFFAVAKGRKSDVEVLKLIPELQDCILRLGKLLAMPEAVPTLYPGLLREVAYWLLRSPSGRRILGMLTPLGYDQRVVRALKYLQESFRNPICVERLAVDLG